MAASKEVEKKMEMNDIELMERIAKLVIAEDIKLLKELAKH